MTPLYHLSQCESTNSEILNFLPSDTPSLVALFTENQTKGRGQYGNRWQSGQHLNLAYSLAVPCQSFSSSALVFNFHTAVLSRFFIDKMTDAQVFLKWPNDLIIANKKIAGLLVEKVKHQGLDYYIFGMGLNLLQVDFGDMISAGSILSQTGKSFDLISFAEDLHSFLVTNILHCDAEKVHSDYNFHLFRKNSISVFEINSIRQNGIIKSVGHEGYLWVELEHDGLKKFAHKELKLLY
jgi:BirA family biotin operon repressor/biotin-[acetyl-CoA-carboxylase] ligase